MIYMKHQLIQTAFNKHTTEAAEWLVRGWGEIFSCSCLTLLPDPAWVLLSKLFWALCTVKIICRLTLDRIISRKKTEGEDERSGAFLAVRSIPDNSEMCKLLNQHLS